ncbi:MAG: polyphosphate kinase 1 [Planctomycetes bacterium]|nr:polyphosphate kinase 1 [Planctomycetota bacterium]
MGGPASDSVTPRKKKPSKSKKQPPAPARRTRWSDPKLYFNRELSLLEFQRRVLAQAGLPGTPLLERLRFLTITSSNLDEFFEIRVAGLKQQIEFGLFQPGIDGRGPVEALEDISKVAHELVDEQYRVLNDEVLPALERAGIRLLRRSDWSERQARWVERYFETEVLPVLTPVALDPAHPFPVVQNKGLNFIVDVEGSDPFGRDVGRAVVPVPRSLPRVIPFPRDLARRYDGFTLLSSVIHANIEKVFPGLQVKGCYQFRVTRNSDLEVDEEEVDNLLKALRSEIRRRRFSHPVRLEVADNCPDEISRFLLQRFRLGPEDLYQVHGPVNLNRIVAMFSMVKRAELKFPTFVPGLPRRLQDAEDIFEVVRRRPVLLHHPYQSFRPVIEWLSQAARDPKVLAIKMTLYRTGADSEVVDALVRAARAGKEVTVVVEIRARFDEEANIRLAGRLQDAGANVVYGVVGHKTHAKAVLIVRREGRNLRRYVHVGTGNYHPGTAQAYTDIGLMSADRELAEDVHHMFMQLTGLGRPPAMNKLLLAPVELYPSLLKMIEEEAEAAARGEKAQIVAKMNSLADPGMIQALYKASQAGVQIDLIVRGICRLRPGVPGVSENIRVRSILGRFLEHPRVYYFHAGGEKRLFGSSADWMERNLHNRIETCFPIALEQHRKRVWREVLKAALDDNSTAWELQADGSYVQIEPPAGKRRKSAQAEALKMLAGQ